MTLATLQIHLFLDIDHTTRQMDHIPIDFTLDPYPLFMSTSVKKCCAKLRHSYKMEVLYCYSLSVAKYRPEE